MLPGTNLGLVRALAADLRVRAALVADPSLLASTLAPAVRRGTRLVLLLVVTCALYPATASAVTPIPSPSPSPTANPALMIFDRSAAVMLTRIVVYAS